MALPCTSSLLVPHPPRPPPSPTCSLRAALNSTQGMGEPFYLGLTPGSAPDLGGGAGAAGGRRKRGSSALRRDWESQGVLSEK